MKFKGVRVDAEKANLLKQELIKEEKISIGEYVVDWL